MLFTWIGNIKISSTLSAPSSISLCPSKLSCLVVIIKVNFRVAMRRDNHRRSSGILARTTSSKPSRSRSQGASISLDHRSTKPAGGATPSISNSFPARTALQSRSSTLEPLDFARWRNRTDIGKCGKAKPTSSGLCQAQAAIRRSKVDLPDPGPPSTITRPVGARETRSPTQQAASSI